MAKEKQKILSSTEGHIVVKNKKFKKSDIIVFCVCIVISLLIWVYATNVEQRNAEKEVPKGSEVEIAQTLDEV